MINNQTSIIKHVIWLLIIGFWNLFGYWKSGIG